MLDLWMFSPKHFVCESVINAISKIERFDLDCKDMLLVEV